MDKEALKTTIWQALREDIGSGDITTNSTIPAEAMFEGQLLAKAAGVVAGLKVAQMTFALLDQRVRLSLKVQDGDRVEAGQLIATIHGPGRAILNGERVALNFLQRLSGIATLTGQFVAAVQGTQAIILDTRKTAPGLRLLDKWAVRLGGGQNHRFGLYDEVLIKDNHIAAVGSIAETVARVRAEDKAKRPIVVEVKDLAELGQVLPLKVTRILLDNMSLIDMQAAVQLAAGRTPLEASGNISLETIAAIAATGVDYISCGVLTHSVKALDISLLL